MLLGRCDVAKIETSDKLGTGFIIEVGDKLFLVTALHVVADASVDPILWSTAIEATTTTVDAKPHRLEFVDPPGQPTDHDANDDWVAFEVKRCKHAGKMALPTGRAHRHDDDKELRAIGHPENAAQSGLVQTGLSGRLAALDVGVQWRSKGEDIVRSCVQARIHEIADGVGPPGASGSPMVIERRVIGILSGYVTVRPASGRVRVVGPLGAEIPVSARLRHEDGRIYVVTRPTVLGDDHLVEVHANDLGSAAQITSGMLEFIAPVPKISRAARIVVPGIQGGAAHLSHACPALSGHALGGIVLITPIERVVQRLEEKVKPAKPGLAAHKQAVHAKICGMLTTTASLGPQIARGSPDWTADAQTPSALATAILESISPVQLTNRFALAMREVTSRKIARKVLDVFELALPVIAGDGLSIAIDEKLYRIALAEPDVAEAMMAYEDRGKIEMELDPIKGNPKPLYCVDLGAQPEVGFDTTEGVSPALEDAASRVADLAVKWLRVNERLHKYSKPTVANMNNEMRWFGTGRRNFYGITANDSDFAKALSQTAIRVIVSSGDTPPDYVEMIAPLGALYRAYFEILREPPK